VKIFSPQLCSPLLTLKPGRERRQQRLRGRFRFRVCSLGRERRERIQLHQNRPAVVSTPQSVERGGFQKRLAATASRPVPPHAANETNYNVRGDYGTQGRVDEIENSQVVEVHAFSLSRALDNDGTPNVRMFRDSGAAPASWRIFA
jgi:hypothetical protein